MIYWTSYRFMIWTIIMWTTWGWLQNNKKTKLYTLTTLYNIIQCMTPIFVISRLDKQNSKCSKMHRFQLLLFQLLLLLIISTWYRYNSNYIRTVISTIIQLIVKSLLHIRKVSENTATMRVSLVWALSLSFTLSRRRNNLFNVVVFILIRIHGQMQL